MLARKWQDEARAKRYLQYEYFPPSKATITAPTIEALKASITVGVVGLGVCTLGHDVHNVDRGVDTVSDHDGTVRGLGLQILGT